MHGQYDKSFKSILVYFQLSQSANRPETLHQFRVFTNTFFTVKLGYLVFFCPIEPTGKTLAASALRSPLESASRLPRVG